ncbi:MAG: YidC/Oxa1 family insertase periplasmic-domain containing protein, partial [Winogradskyella sp.]|nr:YidC/Oxa1 family insertase periplasmic-domain containing protein [Winogradskyella sp.]
MEEKKFDVKSIIGYVLIFGIIIWYFYQNQPSPEELEAQKKAQQEQVEPAQKESKQNEAVVTSSQDYNTIKVGDSLQQVALQNKLGSLSYALTLPGEELTTVETDVFELKFSRKGGHLAQVKLRNFVDYDSVPIYLVKDLNSAFNITFSTSDNRTHNTQDFPFQPNVTKSGENTIVSMKLKVSESDYLEYRYELKPNDYMIDFSIKSQGLGGVFNTSAPVTLDWKQKSIRHAKSISYENRYTRLTYMYEEDKIQPSKINVNQ